MQVRLVIKFGYLSRSNDPSVAVITCLSCCSHHPSVAVNHKSHNHSQQANNKTKRNNIHVYIYVHGTYVFIYIYIYMYTHTAAR